MASSESISDKYVFKLDEKARQYCKEKLNETDENRENSIAALKQWISQNPQYNIKNTERNLLAFLRGCKFDIERTKTKLINFQNLRRDAPELFANRNPFLPEIQDLIEMGVFVPLKKKHNNKLVVIVKVAAHDPAIYKQSDVIKAGKMVLDVAANEDENVYIYGVTAVFDLHGLSFSHARQLTPGIIRKIVIAWQNDHCRPQNLIVINAPSYINVIINVFRKFMSAKLQKRIQVLGSLEELHDVLGKSILPQEYGGDDDEKLQDLAKYWRDKLMKYADWFEEDEKYKSL